MDNQEASLVIRLPRIRLKTFLTPRVLFGAFLTLVLSCFVYWYTAIYPILWISDARVEAFSATLSSDIQGRLTEILFEEGDKVEKGQLLFSLDQEFLRVQQRQLKAKLATLNDQIQREKIRMENAMQQYLSVSSELDFNLTSSEVIQKNLAVLEDAQMKSETANLHLSSLQLDGMALDTQLKKMNVEAPFAAVIAKRWKNVGETVSLGEPVYTLFDPLQTWVVADISEIYLSKIAVGNPVKIRLAAYPNQEWTGKIKRLSPATSDKRIHLTLSIDAKDLFLRPGLSASVGLKVR
jgi:RND family efflux transporter MFP subunit